MTGHYVALKEGLLEVEGEVHESGDGVVVGQIAVGTVVKAVAGEHFGDGIHATEGIAVTVDPGIWHEVVIGAMQHHCRAGMSAGIFNRPSLDQDGSGEGHHAGIVEALREH